MKFYIVIVKFFSSNFEILAHEMLRLRFNRLEAKKMVELVILTVLTQRT